MGKVLHASYSGYFPFCLNKYDLDPPLSAYTPISLEIAMRVWWRIKKLRFYGTYILDPFGPEPQTGDWEFVAERNADSENKLVCNPSPNWLTTSYDGIEEGAAVVLDMSAYKHNDDYILGFGFAAKFLGGTEEQGVNYVSVWEDDSLGTYEFEGLTLYNNGFLFDPTATINHEILEYWSYGGTWNTVTGEPL